MNPFDMVKKIPPKGWIIIGGISALLIGYRVLSGNNSSGSPTPQLSYDPALVALGTEAGLERLRLETGLETERLNAEKELEMFRGQLGFEETALKSNLEFANIELATKSRLDEINMNLNHALAENRSYRDYELGRELGLRNVEAITIASNAEIQAARIAGDSAVKSAKASKSRGISCCGFGLSF